MVRQAHHPEPCRRANYNDQNSKFETAAFRRTFDSELFDPALTTEGPAIEGLTTDKLTAEGLIANADVLVIEDWNLFVIWCLYFGIFYVDVDSSRWFKVVGKFLLPSRQPSIILQS